MVGERAVQLEVQRDDRQRQALAEHRGDGVAAHAVAGVDDDRQRPDAGEVDQAAQVGRVGLQHAVLLDRALPGRGRGLAPALQDRLRAFADLGQAGVLPDRLRALLAQLDAVVLGRVVAGREHRARQVQRAGGEVQQVRRAEPRLDDVGALGPHPRGEGRRERRTRLAHVVRGHDALDKLAAVTQRLHERPAERLGDRLVELVGHRPPHVVGLDDPAQVDHSPRSCRGRCPTPKPSAVTFRIHVSPELPVLVHVTGVVQHERGRGR